VDRLDLGGPLHDAYIEHTDIVMLPAVGVCFAIRSDSYQIVLRRYSRRLAWNFVRVISGDPVYDSFRQLQ